MTSTGCRRSTWFWPAALCLLALANLPAAAQTPEALLAFYGRLARESDPAFAGFSPARGEAFFMQQHQGPNGEHACSSCHGPDPRETVFGHGGAMRAECIACHPGGIGRPGDRARIRRDIKPLAPVANHARFTDPGKSELWFDVNCFYVLGRACGAAEKGDVLAWLLSLR
jgi:hypothetical protein